MKVRVLAKLPDFVRGGWGFLGPTPFFLYLITNPLTKTESFQLSQEPFRNLITFVSVQKSINKDFKH